jgi:hypothetical protein
LEPDLLAAAPFEEKEVPTNIFRDDSTLSALPANQRWSRRGLLDEAP